MFPVLLEIGPLKLYSYGLMIAIGYLTALYFVQREVQRMGLDPNLIATQALITFLLGLAGTRVLHIMMYPSTYALNDPLGWIAVWRGGLVFQGAIPPAFLYAYWTLRRHRIPFFLIADIAAPYLALGQAFGRVGCFLNGCCYGKRADGLPWGICFPEGSLVYQAQSLRYAELRPSITHWSYPVHPTQLYSVAGLLLIFALLLLARKKWHPFDGFALPSYMALYGLFRFTVEFFRGDGNPTVLGFGVLSNQQVFSIILVVGGVVLFQYLSRRAKGGPK